MGLFLSVSAGSIFGTEPFFYNPCARLAYEGAPDRLSCQPWLELGATSRGARVLKCRLNGRSLFRSLTALRFASFCACCCLNIFIFILFHMCAAIACVLNRSCIDLRCLLLTNSAAIRKNESDSPHPRRR